MIIMFAKFALKAWRFLEWRMDSLEAMVRGIRSDLDSAHYSFAAELSDTMDGFSGTTATTEENLEILAARQASFEQEMLEGYNATEQSTNCVRYGLMELGGFVRHASLSAEQVRHMMAQERGNFVVWNLRNRTENTDPIENPTVQGE